MSKHNHLCIRVFLKRSFEGNGVHIPGFSLAVDEYGDSTIVNNGIYRCREGHIRAKNNVTRFYSSKLNCKMQCGSTRYECEGKHLVGAVIYVFCYFLFESVAIESKRRYPILFKRFGDITHLLGVHGRC